MSVAVTNPIAIFLDTWTPEFIRSVATFTGQTVAVEARDAVPAAMPDLLWHEQVLRRRRETREASERGPRSSNDAPERGLRPSSAARIWFGMPIEACASLTAAAAHDEAGGVQLFREILDQSVKAAAQVLNAGACPGLQCADSFGTEAPASDMPAVATCWFRAGQGDPIPVLVRYEYALETMLAGETPAAMSAPLATTPAPAEIPPVFERFVGVELPVSVVLGRATLRVRDVLKLTVGSLVELDRRPSDPVDVCVHDVVVARGEVVSIRGNYGVRVVEVMSQRDRFELQGRGRGLGRLSASGDPAVRPGVH